jgi:hypothetical protein
MARVFCSNPVQFIRRTQPRPRSPMCILRSIGHALCHSLQSLLLGILKCVRFSLHGPRYPRIGIIVVLGTGWIPVFHPVPFVKALVYFALLRMFMLHGLRPRHDPLEPTGIIWRLGLLRSLVMLLLPLPPQGIMNPVSPPLSSLLKFRVVNIDKGQSLESFQIKSSAIRALRL